jgi:hypothetical protein
MKKNPSHLFGKWWEIIDREFPSYFNQHNQQIITIITRAHQTAQKSQIKHVNKNSRPAEQIANKGETK